MVSSFIFVSPLTKLNFRATSVLFPTLITFYKMYCVFGISFKSFVNVINLIKISPFKSWIFRHQGTIVILHNSQGRIFSPDGPVFPATSILGKTDLTRWPFKLLPFLKPILGISVKTFLCHPCGASKICSSSNMIVMFLKTEH